MLEGQFFCKLFHTAIIEGNIETLKSLSIDEKYANAVLAENGQTALMLACQRGHCAIAEYLLLHGAVVNSVDQDGYTALLYAAQCGCLETVRLLKKHGANVQARSKNGDTVLSRAAYCGHFMICLWLSSECEGVDVNAVNDEGVSALMKAKCADTAKTLLRLGADPNQADDLGWTPLIWAASLGQHKIVDVLLNYNADARLITKSGKTALSIAEQKGHKVTAGLLRFYVGDSVDKSSSSNVETQRGVEVIDLTEDAMDCSDSEPQTCAQPTLHLPSDLPPASVPPPAVVHAVSAATTQPTALGAPVSAATTQSCALSAPIPTVPTTAPAHSAPVLMATTQPPALSAPVSAGTAQPPTHAAPVPAATTHSPARAAPVPAATASAPTCSTAVSNVVREVIELLKVDNVLEAWECAVQLAVQKQQISEGEGSAIVHCWKEADKVPNTFEAKLAKFKNKLQTRHGPAKGAALHDMMVEYRAMVGRMRHQKWVNLQQQPAANNKIGASGSNGHLGVPVAPAIPAVNVSRVEASVSDFSSTATARASTSLVQGAALQPTAMPTSGGTNSAPTAVSPVATGTAVNASAAPQKDRSCLAASAPTSRVRWTVTQPPPSLLPSLTTRFQELKEQYKHVHLLHTYETGRDQAQQLFAAEVAVGTEKCDFKRIAMYGMEISRWEESIATLPITAEDAKLWWDKQVALEEEVKLACVTLKNERNFEELATMAVLLDDVRKLPHAV